MPICRTTPRRAGSAAAMLSSSASASSFFPCCINRVACSKLPSCGAADAAAGGAESCFDESCRGCDCACKAAQAVNAPISKQRKWIRSSSIWNFPAVAKPRLEHKKRGACQEAHRRGGRASSSLLERESQSEREQPHRGVIFDVGNSSGIGTGAIDARIALGVVETHDWVVKDVVGIHAEFRLETLFDGEVLCERHIRSEEVRSTE